MKHSGDTVVDVQEHWEPDCNGTSEFSVMDYR